MMEDKSKLKKNQIYIIKQNKCQDNNYISKMPTNLSKNI